MASTGASSNDAIASYDNPKFSEYRSQVMLGELPTDFLRIQLVESQIYDPFLAQQDNNPDPNFLGHFTLTIAEAKLIKNSGPLGLLRMDPYVRFQIGHISHETPTAAGGGKNPQWKISYRINLFKGIEKIHVEIFDQRSFTEDSFIGQCDITIPREVLEGQTHQQWYPLMGRDANLNENQGDILIIMSLTVNSYLKNILRSSDLTLHLSFIHKKRTIIFL
jgi:toll-interacting protein